MKEVELKVFLGPGAADELHHLLSSKYGEPMVQTQEDIYYTSKHKDFIASEECLRIRRSGDKEELTWKPPTTHEMLSDRQYWKEEHNIDIRGKVSEFRHLFDRLDFIEYVVVSKIRAEFRVDGNTSISLDRIADVGTFLEIETMSEDHRSASLKNQAELVKLGLEGRVRVTRPYRDIVKDGQIEALRAEG